MPVTLEQITARLNVPELFQQNGARGGRQKGEQMEGATCPFCDDPDHFGYNSKAGLWKCRKCGESGNLVTLVSKVRKCPTGQAFKALMAEAGLTPEEVRPPKKRGRPPGTGRKAAPGGDDGKLPVSNVNAGRIYERFVELLPLTDAHRQKLQKKRGFTLTTIETFRLRSGGPHVAGILSQLADEFGESDLLDAALTITVNGRACFNDQLLEDRIIIPYLDERGAPYHIRPHKLGLERPLEPYARCLLKERPEHVILTEGEFKAIALRQWRIPAIGVPGVSSFGGKNFERLADLLKEFGVKQVVVVFDNEIKDDPSLPTFKPRIEDRYDTQMWAYLTAYKLGREGFAARVGTLPDEWRVNGKVDFDGALAAGHAREEILGVVGRAVPPRDYLDQLPDEARRIVRRKVARHFARLNVRREFNRYVITRHRNGESYEETISNFVINIKSSFYTAEGVIRMVELVNEHGETSDAFTMAPGDMAGLNEFKKFCFSKGAYIFSGRGSDLTEIWELEFLRDTGELIFMPDRIGRVGHDLWLFGTMAISGGKVYRPDGDGIVWVEGRGYKPQSLQLGPRGEAVEDAIPALSERKVDIREVAERLRDAVGGYEAYMAIGWVIATLFSEDVFARYKCLPIFYPHGKRESGKSTFMRWVMSFFGIETEGYGLAETTQNFITRALSYYSSLGAWFDEYRNEPRVTQKDGYLRSAYNRQLSGKGTATAFQARGFAVHGAVAVSGEELPRDNGLYTRLVPVQISAHKRSRTWYDWLNRHCTEFSGFARELLVNYSQHRDRIIANIAELKNALIRCDVSDRTAENWAICAGAFDAVVLQDNEFIKWVEQTCQEIRRVGEAEHILNQFWEDVGVLIASEELGPRYLRKKDGMLCVWFPAVYDIWATHYRKRTGREPFDRISILKYFQDEPYYAGAQSVRFDSAVRKAQAIDLGAATDTIREIAASLQDQPEDGGSPTSGAPCNLGFE